MATLLVRVLVSISIFQFIIILQLLIVKRDSFGGSSCDSLSSTKEMVRTLYKMDGEVYAANVSTGSAASAASGMSTMMAVKATADTRIVKDNDIAGVAVTVFLHSPTWFQRRYTMMIYNILFNLPEGWVIQIFGTGQGQSAAGLLINRGLQRLVDKGVVRLTIIPPEVFNKRRKLVYLMTDPWLWSHMLADKVLIFGGNQVRKRVDSCIFTADYILSPHLSLRRRRAGDLLEQPVLLERLRGLRLDWRPLGLWIRAHAAVSVRSHVVTRSFRSGVYAFIYSFVGQFSGGWAATGGSAFATAS